MTLSALPAQRRPNFAFSSFPTDYISSFPTALLTLLRLFNAWSTFKVQDDLWQHCMLGKAENFARSLFQHKKEKVQSWKLQFTLRHQSTSLLISLWSVNQKNNQRQHQRTTGASPVMSLALFLRTRGKRPFHTCGKVQPCYETELVWCGEKSPVRHQCPLLNVCAAIKISSLIKCFTTFALKVCHCEVFNPRLSECARKVRVFGKLGVWKV